MANPIRTKLSILAVGFAGLTFGVLFASALDWTPSSRADLSPQATVSSVSNPVGPSLRETGNAFTAIARAVTPAVVSVRVGRLEEVGANGRDLGPFEDFFDFRSPNGNGQRMQPRRSGGSGVIIRSDGYIVTNNHVVEDGESIQVVMNDRRTFSAELVGRDPSTDLAVLRIDGDEFPWVTYGADDLEVGEWVLALGNPFGLEFTMTAGIVSAIGRGGLNIINRGDNPYAIENFIQTDAAINPGNSGGPLVNINGQVVGINTAIASRTGGYQGYGFAIPVSIVRHVVDELIETGKIERAILGVQIEQVRALDQEALGLPAIAGVRITDFSDIGARNPAVAAGLQINDVVLSVEKQSVSTVSELQEAIAFHKPGEDVELSVWRNRSQIQLSVQLGRRPDPNRETQLASADAREDGSATALGMQVRNISDETRASLSRRLNIDESDIPRGVFVADVEPFSSADEAGFSRGLIVTAVGDTEIETVEQYRAAIGRLAPGSIVYLSVFVPSSGGSTIRPIRVPR